MRARGPALIALLVACGKPAEPARATIADFRERWLAQEARIRHARTAVVDAPVAAPCATPPAAITVGVARLAWLLQDERDAEGAWDVGPVDELAEIGQARLRGLPLRDAGRMEAFRSQRELEEIDKTLARLAKMTHLVVLTVDDYLPSDGKTAGWIGGWAIAAPLDAGGAACAGYVTVQGGADDRDPDLVDRFVDGAEAALAAGTPRPPPRAPARKALPGPSRDVDGDGLADLVLAMPARGEVWMYNGEKDAGPTMWNQRLLGREGFGRAAAIVGDLTGDGFADALVSDDKGGIWLASGSKKGLVRAAKPLPAPAKPAPEHGAVIAALGDVDGDGLADALVGGVGADDFDPTAAGDGDEDDRDTIRPGMAYLYRGDRKAIRPGPPIVSSSSKAALHFATSLAGPGDVDGDGLADALIAREGGAQLHVGMNDGLSPEPHVETDDWVAGVVSAAGDVNADGYADALVGDELRLGTKRGVSARAIAVGQWVAGVGDVTGDGVDDLVRVGRAQLELYAGVAGGLPTRPARRLDYPFAVETEADMLDRSARAAGDVDGDGRADFVVVIDDDQRTTRVLLYRGGHLDAPPMELGTAPQD